MREIIATDYGTIAVEQSNGGIVITLQSEQSGSAIPVKVINEQSGDAVTLNWVR